MNIEQTKNVLKNMPKDKSVMLHAKHGVGKSSVVKQVSKDLNIGFYDVRLSQCEVGDIKGLPSLEDDKDGRKVVKFAKPEWFPTDPDSSGILFFDELNRASKDVLQAVFEICLDRRLDGVKLPDGWRVVAAVNSDDDYDVVELDPALQDRWFHIDFDPSVQEWVKWARDSKVHPAVVEFVNRNNNLLDPPVGNLEAGRVYPSRRSWVALSDCMMALSLDKDPVMLTQVTKGWLGREIAVMFEKFVNNEFSQLKAEDVLDSFEDYKDQVESSCDDIEVIAALASSVVDEANRRTAKKMGDVQKENLKKFFMVLPNDVASQSWVSLLNGKRTKKIVMKWQSDDKIADRLQEIYLQ